jgi:hypothetical protein
VAAALNVETDAAAMFQRFLLHPASAASVYYHELRSRLHPDIQDVAQALDELLVRTGRGRYVIRPARRAAAAQWLARAEGLAMVVDRLHQELCAWADELVDEDALHQRFKEALRQRPFAEYLAVRAMEDRDRLRDEDLEGMFWELEEATDDVAAGLRLNQESEACREWLGQIERFSAVWQHRPALREPLARLVEGIEEQDELHRGLREYLRSDDALIALAATMDYLPRSAAEAAREWLAYRVTRTDDGGYSLTAESPEELTNELSGFFAEFREIRRRGRGIDAFAARLANAELKRAMQSFLGKLLLRDLLQEVAVPEEVDGLQLWIDEHFEETAEGLVLREGAAEAINELLEQAEELRAQLEQTDF